MSSLNLYQYLTISQHRNLLDLDDDWRRFIIDHLAFVKANSTPIIMDQSQYLKYRYNLNWFLKENESVIELKWIFLLLNNLDSEVRFSIDWINYHKPVWFVPNLTYIENLRTDFDNINTTQTTAKSSSWDL